MSAEWDAQQAQKRAEFVAARVAALRSVADLIEAHPDLCAQYSPITLLHNVFTAEELADLARQLGGKRVKEADEQWYTVSRDFGGGVSMQVYADRSAVCERVVVGTETVEVVDPDAPKVTVEREVVEWQCAPSLAALGDQS